MKNRTQAFLLALFLAGAVHADPIEVVLQSKITEVKDAKTTQRYVLRGNRARIVSKVAIHAKGAANSGLRQWLKKRLPTSIDGYFEREDKDSGLAVRYKPVPFTLRKKEIFCTAASTPNFEVCHADYSVSSTNSVDIPAGDGGSHFVSIQMLPPSGDLRVKMAKADAKTYQVLSGDPKLSKLGFAGLPEH